MSSIQEQLNSFVQAHYERQSNIPHNTFVGHKNYSDILCAPSAELQDCMQELSQLVLSPDFSATPIDIDNEYEVVEDHELWEN